MTRHTLLPPLGEPATEADPRTHDRTVTDGTRAESEHRVTFDRQHDAFGGIKWGAAFFGWLAANGLAVILAALLSAAGVAFGLTKGVPGSDTVSANAEAIGLGGAIAAIVLAAIAYFAGGYVAGRMARFDGAKQGFAVWLIGILVVLALAIAGAVFGSEYNVLERLDLPRIPIDEGTATTGAVITLVLVTLGTLVAAMLGGKTGTRYHRRIDEIDLRDRY